MFIDLHLTGVCRLKPERRDGETVKHRLKQALGKHYSEEDIEVTAEGLRLYGSLHGCGHMNATLHLSPAETGLAYDIHGRFSMGVWAYLFLVLAAALSLRDWSSPYPYFCGAVFVILCFRWWYKLHQPKAVFDEAFRTVESELQ